MAGVYTDTILNAVGCDSILHLVLNINESKSDTINKIACEQFYWPETQQTYFQSGIDTDSIKTTKDCDSLRVLDLKITEPDSSGIIEDSCTGFLWSVNNQFYDSSGIFYDTLINQHNCDSIVSLNLTISSLDRSLLITKSTFIAHQNGAKYQWIDCENAYQIVRGQTFQSFSPIDFRKYAVAIQLNDCKDTSRCVQLNWLGGNEFNKDPQLFIYPNPNSGLFHLKGPSELKGNFTIANAQGRIIYKLENQPINNHTISIDGAAGCYFLSIELASEILKFQLIKQ